MRLTIMALFECPRCGTKLYYEGKVHPCKGGKSSGGIAEGREAQDRRQAKGVAPNRKPLEVGAVAQQAERGPSQGLRSEVRSLSTPVGIKANPPETKLARSSAVELAAHNGSVAGSKPAAPTKSKRGRPPKPDSEPISRATLYRRKKAQEK
jgi:hypothetical protein